MGVDSRYMLKNSSTALKSAMLLNSFINDSSYSSRQSDYLNFFASMPLVYSTGEKCKPNILLAPLAVAYPSYQLFSRYSYCDKRTNEDMYTCIGNNDYDCLDKLVSSCQQSILPMQTLKFLDVNHIMTSGTYQDLTPLIAAVNQQDSKSMKLLIDHGANPNMRDSSASPETPYWHAIIGDKLGVISTLVGAGVDKD